MKKRFFTTRTVAELGILTALVIGLQFFSNHVTFGTVSITLALIPIVIGAILYGPLGGLFLGLVCGGITILAPSTLAEFMPHNAWATILLCLTKMGAAGALSGLVFMLFRKNHPKVGVVIAAIIVPLTNTGIFAGGAYLFFYDILSSAAETAGVSVPAILFLSWIGINFIIEFVVNSILAPALYFLYRYIERRTERNRN